MKRQKVDTGDVVWLDATANGFCPGATNAWWEPGEEHSPWVVGKTREWPRSDETDNPLVYSLVHHVTGRPILERGTPGASQKFFIKDEFLSAVRKAIALENK